MQEVINLVSVKMNLIKYFESYFITIQSSSSLISYDKQANWHYHSNCINSKLSSINIVRDFLSHSPIISGHKSWQEFLILIYGRVDGAAIAGELYDVAAYSTERGAKRKITLQTKLL